MYMHETWQELSTASSDDDGNRRTADRRAADRRRGARRWRTSPGEAGVSAQTVSRVSNGRTERRRGHPASGSWPRCGSSATGRTAPPARCAAAVPHHRRDHLHALDLRQHAHPRRDRHRGGATPATRSPCSRCRTRPRARSRAPSAGSSEQAVDGVIIIIEAHLLDDADVALPPGLPVVVVDSNAGDRYPVVDTDQAQGARLATEHLLDLGHRTVWHLAGPERSFAATRRARVLAADAARAGRDRAAGCSTATGRPSPATGPASSSPTTPRCTAIFAANDQMALGAAARAARAGPRGAGATSASSASTTWRRPRSLLAAAHHRPPGLRRGRPPLRRGAPARDRVGRPRRGHHARATELVVRESTAPPRA